MSSKKQNLESCKTVRRWQRSILLVKGGHCVGDCVYTRTTNLF